MSYAIEIGIESLVLISCQTWRGLQRKCGKTEGRDQKKGQLDIFLNECCGSVSLLLTIIENMSCPKLHTTKEIFISGSLLLSAEAMIIGGRETIYYEVH